MISVNGQNHDPNGSYISDSGYPWAISIIHDFKVPKESVRINEAYNLFSDWATSGGLVSKDWYKVVAEFDKSFRLIYSSLELITF